MIKVNDQIDQNVINDVIKSLPFYFSIPPKIKIEAIDSSRCGNNGSVKVTINGGSGSFKYYVNGLEFSVSNNLIGPLSNGNHFLTIVDTNGCFDQDTITVPDACPPCLSGVINKYSPVTNICKNRISVANPEKFLMGDYVMIHQAKGAMVFTDRNSSFGSVFNYGSSGLFEFNVIKNIDNEDIYLYNELNNEYDVNSGVQLVTIPDLSDKKNLQFDLYTLGR